jgi:hypothetical protein
MLGVLRVPPALRAWYEPRPNTATSLLVPRSARVARTRRWATGGRLVATCRRERRPRAATNIAIRGSRHTRARLAALPNLASVRRALKNQRGFSVWTSHVLKLFRSESAILVRRFGYPKMLHPIDSKRGPAA